MSKAAQRCGLPEAPHFLCGNYTLPEKSSDKEGTMNVR